jgi:RNA polymerase sigma-70 factor (ECF subfamily)
MAIYEPIDRYGLSGMPSERTFPEILTAAKRGEEWAWQELYRSISGRLIGYLTIKGAVEPEDQAAETLLQVARNIASFEGDEDSFRSWVFVIAHRRMIDARRSKGRRLDTTELDVERGGSTGNVEDEALEQITTRETVAALEILTGEQREVIILRVLADLSLQQTADVMGKRVGSIKALQRRALANLRIHFESLGVSR